jgi:hypothetical protein
MGMFDETPQSYLRLRDTGDGKWAIVRVVGWQKFAKEVVASGLTRKQAEQMIALAKEE